MSIATRCRPLIDSCPMEGFVPAEFDKVLELTAPGYVSVVCRAPGYRSENDKSAVAAKGPFSAPGLMMELEYNAAFPFRSMIA
jgi:hypothetical protein